MGNNQIEFIWKIIKLKVCLGLYTPRAKHVFMRKRKLRWELVADTKKLCYSSLSLANIQTLRIGDADFNLYLLDNKV